jgi:hypothetical protein
MAVPTLTFSFDLPRNDNKRVERCGIINFSEINQSTYGVFALSIQTNDKQHSHRRPPTAQFGWHTRIVYAYEFA